jgi:hypothetical protein
MRSYNAAIIAKVLIILPAVLLVIFMWGAPLWPWLMRRRR